MHIFQYKMMIRGIQNVTWYQKAGKRTTYNEGYLGIHDVSMFPNRELSGAMTRVSCSLTFTVAVPCSHRAPNPKNQSATRGAQ
jgi:hypothetical protein